MASEWGAQAAAPCSGNDLPARGRPDYITEITCSLKNSKVREAIKLSAWQSQLVLHQLPRLGTSRVGTSQEDGHVWVNKPVAIPQRYCLLNSSICARDISRLAPPRLIKILVLFFFCCFFFIIYFFSLDAMIDGVPINPAGSREDIPKHWARFGATGHGAGFHPWAWLRSLGCLTLCSHLWEYFTRPRMENPPSPSAQHLGMRSWCRWQHSPTFSLCWPAGFSAKEDVGKGSHPVGASDTFQLLLFSFG